MKIHKNGFTLIESLVSMVLICSSALFIMKCMIVSLDSVKDSDLKFRVYQDLENKKNDLLGISFDSPALSPGSHIDRSGFSTIKINIANITDSLKKIVLKGTLKNHSSGLSFYRSGTIMEVRNE